MIYTSIITSPLPVFLIEICKTEISILFPLYLGFDCDCLGMERLIQPDFFNNMSASIRICDERVQTSPERRVGRGIWERISAATVEPKFWRDRGRMRRETLKVPRLVPPLGKDLRLPSYLSRIPLFRFKNVIGPIRFPYLYSYVLVWDVGWYK